MHKACEEFFGKCLQCQVLNPTPNKMLCYSEPASYRLWGGWAVDYVEFDGDLLLMLMVNTVSSWVEMSLLQKTADFHAIWKQFRQKVIAKHEVPEHVTTDNDLRHADRFEACTEPVWHSMVPHHSPHPW